MSAAVLSSGGVEHVIRVLVVDDSAVAREVLSTVLRRDGFDVEVASGAHTAMQRIAGRRPDVVVLDLEMPHVGGLEFLDRLMRSNPLPVIVCSGIAQPGARAAIRALELGAVEVIPKPSVGVRALLEDSERPLSAIVRAAASANTNRLAGRSQPTLVPTPAKPHVRPSGATWTGGVIVIGASTGGTEALRTLLTELPDDAPPIAIVQHMPGAFTPAFAQRLNSLCAIEVREAQDGDVLTPGLALIAPGGHHMELATAMGATHVRVFDGLPVSGHCPSVDVLFRSAARVLGRRGVGVLLTGMGADGARGLLQMRDEGGHTIAQNEATCVVFGMPGEAVALGAARAVLPIDNVASAMSQAALTIIR
jgi:two-component system chemotaxis response regulator CheB